MGHRHGAQEGQRQRTARLRQRARQLLAEGKSIRQIADILGLSRSTAHRYATSTPGSAPPPPPRGAANQRATTHGVWSAPVIGELQAAYRVKAQARWPFLSGDDTETWSRLAARVEQAAAHE